MPGCTPGASEISAQSAYLDMDSFSGYLIESTIHILAKPGALKGMGGTGQTKDINGMPVEPAPAVAPAKPASDATDTEEATESFLRTRDPYGVYLDVIHDPQARTNLILRGEKVIIHSKLHFSAENASITADDMAHPMYGMRSSNVDFFMHEVPTPGKTGKTEVKPEKLVAKHPRITIFGFSSIPGLADHVRLREQRARSRWKTSGIRAAGGRSRSRASAIA